MDSSTNESWEKIREIALRNVKKNSTGKQKKQDCYNCSKCKDTSWVFDAKTNTYKRCKCFTKNILKRAWEASGIKDNTKTFKDFEVWNDSSRKLKDTAMEYYKNFDKIRGKVRNSIMLCGQPGCGKTSLSLALANNFITSKGIRVIYMPYRETITAIKQNMVDEEYYKKMVNKYKTAEVLLIDDLFKGKVNETDVNIMFEIVNYRYTNHLPVIVSTEYTLSKLLYFDESIGSRLYEMSKHFLVQVEGVDNNYRLR